jgi:hypothetical protein
MSAALMPGAGPATFGWVELRFFGGPADGQRMRFRSRGGLGHPSPTLLLRDPAREPGSPRHADEPLHEYRYEIGLCGRGCYRYKGMRRLP